MKYEPGQSGNPSGRPKGSGNKATTKIREQLAALLDGGHGKLKTELGKLEGRDYVSAYTNLLPYVVPRLQNTSLDINPEDLSDEQLDYIIQTIMDKANK
jgi:hypothetical protein